MSLIPATRMLLKFRPTTPLLTPRLQQLQVRHASSSSIKPPRKPIVLEKPAKFNPPSHAARLPRRAPRGAALPTYGRSEKEKEGGRKRYPNMMPEEGTFLHWFLTSKGVHVWITMSILTSLALFTFLTNFLTSTPYLDQLPPNNFFFSHPFAFIGQYVRVYHLHTEWTSQQTAEHRRQKVEDVRKRSEYRKAHGLEDQGFFGGWTVKSDEEVRGGGMTESGVQGVGPAPAAFREGGDLQSPIAVEGEAQEVKAAGEGARRPPVKKWLGIW